MDSALLAASTIETAGAVIAATAVVLVAAYALFNIRAGHKEVGSETELAPNRKPYFDDETLETRKLNRTLVMGLGFLLILAVGLPLYWLHEPGRQDGAVTGFESSFVSRGEEQFAEGAQCASCHGSSAQGAVASYTLQDAEGNFVATVNWRAPALNTVYLRFSREEIANIIEFGRPDTPMAGWGAGGNGPLNEQQIDNVVDFLEEISLTPDEARAEVGQQLAIDLGYLDPNETDEQAIADAVEQVDYLGDERVGEAMFSIGDGEPSLASGAYACARCHTKGWSVVDGSAVPPNADLSEFTDWREGSGAYGPALDDEVPRQFATVDELAEFIATGSEEGIGYGNQGQGSGRMPGFGDNPNTEDETEDGMYSAEQVCAVAMHAAGLPDGEIGDASLFTADGYCAVPLAERCGLGEGEVPSATEWDSFCTSILQDLCGTWLAAQAEGGEEEADEEEEEEAAPDLIIGVEAQELCNAVPEAPPEAEEPAAADEAAATDEAATEEAAATEEVAPSDEVAAPEEGVVEDEGTVSQ